MSASVCVRELGTRAAATVPNKGAAYPSKKKRNAMKKLLRRAAMAALLVSVSSLSASLIYTADAAQQQKGKQQKETGPSARKEIAVPINDALKQVDMKDFAGALVNVKKADAVQMKTPYEEYMVSKYLGFIAVNQPMPDYAAAT